MDQLQLIDTHCHLDFPQFDGDRDEVVKRAGRAGVSRIINVASSVEGSRKSVKLASEYPGIYAVVGIHPHDADTADQAAVAEIENLSKKDKVVAIGEIGLDYYKNYSDPQKQRDLFTAILKNGRNCGLPVVIHSRQAEEDTLKIINQFMPLKAVVHCFSGDENFLKRCLDLGFFVSFTCNITYKKSDDLRNIVKIVPLDRIMLETDAPYLSPEGLRGKRNEPSNVRDLCCRIARIRGVSEQEIARATTGTAVKFFNLD